MGEKKPKEEHAILFLLDHNLYCYKCGDTFEYSRLLPIPINMASVIMKEFGKTHRRCKQTERGKEVEALNNRKWEARNESNPSQQKP